VSRPVKLTVDYFSHDANASSRKTLTILFNHFGHEGISGWWQLLERLADTPNHFLDIRNPECFEYLAARLRFSPDRARAIFSKMADLDAIDRELYTSGIIWSQNLIDRLAGVYKSRNQDLPSKPCINNPVSLPNNSIDLPDNTQTKVKETKVKEIKEPTGDKSPVNPFDCCFELDDFLSLSETFTDKVAFLVLACKKLHPVVNGCGPRLAGIWRDAGRDTPAVMEAIWKASRQDIADNPLDFIQGLLKSHHAKIKAQDPDKYIKGKYGHVVRRA
jgi:hypothetical protein